MADLDAGRRCPGFGPGHGDQGVDRRGGEVGQECAVARARHRLAGVHVQLAERGGGDHRDGVHLWAEPAQRADQLGAGARVAEAGSLEDGEGPAAQRLGDLGQRRHPQQVADGGDLVRDRCGPFAPGVQDLRGALDREEQVPGVQLPDRVQPHLQRGHHPHAAAAPDRPEQVRLVAGVGADQVTAGGDELGRGDAVGGQPVTAGQKAEPAAQGVAGHTDARRAPGQPGQAVLCCRDDHVLPHRAGLGAGGAGSRVNVDPPQDVVRSSIAPSSGSSGAAPWPVPCGAIRIARARAYRTVWATSAADSASTTTEGRWSTARFHAWRAWSSAGLARDENLARDSRPQGFQVAVGNGVLDGHCFLLSFVAPAWGYGILRSCRSSLFSCVPASVMTAPP